MQLHKVKAQVREIVEANPFITKIRTFELLGNKEYVGLILVDKSATPMLEGEELSAFYFSACEDKSPTAICTVTPQEYQDILDKKLIVPNDWFLGDVIFDGCITFNNIDDLIKSINDWMYPVSYDDDSLRRIYGFKCVSGRRWKIKLTDLKRSMVGSKLLKNFSFSTKAEKDKFLNFLNTKPPYEEILR